MKIWPGTWGTISATTISPVLGEDVMKRLGGGLGVGIQDILQYPAHLIVHPLQDGPHGHLQNAFLVKLFHCFPPYIKSNREMFLSSSSYSFASIGYSNHPFPISFLISRSAAR